MEIEKSGFISDLKDFKSQLSNLGAKKTKSIHIIDYYVCKKEINTFEKAQQHDIGSCALRIRKNISPDKVDWEINCKVLAKTGDHCACHEHETQVVDGEVLLQILDSIGFKVFCVLDKTREMYSLNNVTINVEDIKNFKPAVELEILSDSNVEQNKRILDDLLIKLKIKKEDLIEKSITYLYMKEFSFK